MNKPVKSEFKEKTLDLRRVTRVVAGGKRFRFRATVVLGDERGRVGVGVAKGLDAQQAVEKARVSARKNMISVPLSGTTIPHEVSAKFSAARIIIRPATRGHGLKAGGAARAVLLLGGVRDATAKALGGTKNKLTNALVAIEALRNLKPVKKRDVRNEKMDEKLSRFLPRHEKSPALGRAEARPGRIPTEASREMGSDKL